MWYIILFLCSYYLGWYCHKWKTEAELARDIEEAYKDAEESIKNQPKELFGYMKVYSDIYYVFEKETNRFLIQGKNEQELYKHLTDRFPGYKLWIVEKNAKEVGYVK